MPAYIIANANERERKAEAARVRFEHLTLELASERRFGGPDASSIEIDILEEATRLVKQSRAVK